MYYIIFACAWLVIDVTIPWPVRLLAGATLSVVAYIYGVKLYARQWKL